MSRVTLEESVLTNIGNAIRGKNKQSTLYKPREMPAAIDAIETGITPTGSKTITANGTHDVTTFASAVVSVPNSYTSSDEGKVVSGGSLVSQTAKNINANGTHDTTINNSVVVSVPNSYTAGDEGKVVSDGALVAQTAQTVTENGTYDTTLISELIANISGGGGDIEQYNILKNATWEQGAIQSNIGATYASNKVSYTTRIRLVSLVPVGVGTPLYIKINDGFDATINYYNSSGICANSGSSWGGFDNKSLNFAHANIAIALKKTNGNDITPSEVLDTGIAVYDVASLIENGGGGVGIQTGTTPPTSDMGSDGDYYKQIFPISSDVNFVEYLQSSGTQYIDTGIHATQDIDAMLVADRSAGIGAPFGVRTGSWGSMSNFLYFGNHADSSTAISVMKGGTSVSGSYANVGGVSIRRTKTIKREDGRYLYLGMIDDNNYVKVSLQTGTWISSSPIAMFAVYFSDTLTKATAKIHRAVIYDSGCPIKDYLPCLDANGVACMWDNVAKEYVYNDGTGDFAYGSAVIPSELEPILYVKENGAWRVIGQ